MVEGAPVMHEGELIGFVKKEYETARLIEVILTRDPGRQIDLKALKEDLRRLSKPYKALSPEAAELLDEDSILVSRALANSVALPFVKPVMKTLVPLEMFKPIAGTQHILQMDLPGQDLTFGIEDRLAGIPGLAGEWFVGRVDGIIIRRRHGSVEVPVRTGMMAPRAEGAGECLTIFDLNNGLKTFKTLAEANIPIMHGDVMLVDGALDEKKAVLRARLIFLIRSREMWVFD
ncbi:MAG: hypothetical protein ACPL4E_08590 [Thermoproteota archaeon]